MYLSDRPHAPRAGTVGWPVAGYEVRIDGVRPLPGFVELRVPPVQPLLQRGDLSGGFVPAFFIGNLGAQPHGDIPSGAADPKRGKQD